MKLTILALAILAAASLQFSGFAQTTNSDAAAPMIHTNTAIIPVPRTGSITNRQSQVLKRAQDNPGDYDIEFIGDSITQGWEGAGKNVWKQYIGSQLIESDGSISKSMMKDYLHPGEAGYKIWAEAMEPKLKEILGN